MALSGTITTSKTTAAGSGYPGYIYLTWSASQNAANNTSTISWSCYGGSNYDNTSNWVMVGPVTVVINGTTVLSKTNRFEMKKGQLLGSGTTSAISHNSDGTKSVSISISAAVYTFAVNCTYSGSITLDTIAQSSTLQYQSDVYVGRQTYFTINKKTSSATHTITYKYNTGVYSDSGTIVSKTSSTSISWTPPTSFVAHTPEDSYISLSITLQTHIGSTVRSVTYTGIRCWVPDELSQSAYPTIGSFTASPIGGYNYWIQGKNKIRLSVSGGDGGLAQISSYDFYDNGNWIATVTPYSSAYASSASYDYSSNTSGAHVFSVVLTNSVGTTATKTYLATCYAYSAPAFTTFTTSRCNADGSANVNGSYIKCLYNISHSSVNGSNAIVSVDIYINNSRQTPVSQTSGYTIISASGSISDIYGEATDTYGGVGRSNSSAVYESRIFNAAADGMGFAIGMLSSDRTTSSIKTATTNGLFECAFDADFKKGLFVNGNPVLTSYNYQNYISGAGAVESLFTADTSSGNTGSFTIYNKNLGDYECIDVFYVKSNATTSEQSLGCTRLYSPSGKKIDISMIYAHRTEGRYIYIFNSTYSITSSLDLTGGTPVSCIAFTYVKSVNVTFDGRSGTTSTSVTDGSHTSGTNYLGITKILGHKK